MRPLLRNGRRREGTPVMRQRQREREARGGVARKGRNEKVKRRGGGCTNGGEWEAMRG